MAQWREAAGALKKSCVTCPCCHMEWNDEMADAAAKIAPGQLLPQNPLNLATHSELHAKPMTLEESYPGTHQWIGKRDSAKSASHDSQAAASSTEPAKADNAISSASTWSYSPARTVTDISVAAATSASSRATLGAADGVSIAAPVSPALARILNGGSNAATSSPASSRAVNSVSSAVASSRLPPRAAPCVTQSLAYQQANLVIDVECESPS